jgi:rhodanese-related sulfurtransferase
MKTNRVRSIVRRAFLSAAIAAAFVAIGESAFAFDLGKVITNDPAPPDSFKLIHVADLAALIANKNSHVNIYDANRWSLRSTVGVIPGAHMLTSPDQYDVAGTLPAAKDAKVVFYCADTRCMASHEAARRATDAGYSDVSVMADGIFGWKAAGEPVAKPEGFKSASQDE